MYVVLLFLASKTRMGLRTTKNASKAALFSRKFTGLMYVLLKACDKEGRQAFVVKKAAFQPDKIF